LKTLTGFTQKKKKILIHGRVGIVATLFAFPCVSQRLVFAKPKYVSYPRTLLQHVYIW